MSLVIFEEYHTLLSLKVFEESNVSSLVKVIDSYSPGLNQSSLLNGMDGIKRVDPSVNPLEGLFAISEFATYQTFRITVAALPQIGWARTWGEIYYDRSQSVASDSSGNIYIAGWFEGTVDFDPTDGIDNHSSVDASDAFLSKFDSSGNFKWAKTWGGTWPDCARGVDIDASGNIYVSGYFRDVVDFNPGSGIENHTAAGNSDCFLSKFNAAGYYRWSCTWGGTNSYQGRASVVDDAGNSDVTGFFWDAVDFNPGSGVDSHTSLGMGDAFLSKFDTSGTFQWVRVWGGTLYEQDRGVALDSLGNVYVTGWFADMVDFNTGAGTEEYSTNGVDDVFLSKFDSSGTFQWARTWGGLNFDYGYDVSVDSSGNAYVTGKFWDVVDFGPSEEIDSHTSLGVNDVYLSKFNTSGDFLWAQSWGGTDNDTGEGTAIDSFGNIYVTGAFSGTVDFDLSLGIDEHISNGSEDAFLCKFDSNGNSLWARTWGGIETDHAYRTSVDGYNNACAVGSFANTVDFNPSLEIDEHISNGGEDVFLSKFLPDGSW
jgi:hypothetical protein